MKAVASQVAHSSKCQPDSKQELYFFERRKSLRLAEPATASWDQCVICTK